MSAIVVFGEQVFGRGQMSGREGGKFPVTSAGEAALGGAIRNAARATQR